MNALSGQSSRFPFRSASLSPFFLNNNSSNNCPANTHMMRNRPKNSIRQLLYLCVAFVRGYCVTHFPVPFSLSPPLIPSIYPAPTNTQHL